MAGSHGAQHSHDAQERHNPPQAPPRIMLLSKPGCHLCDDARAVVEKVAADMNVSWEERDITQSDDDMREYWDKIPVTLVDGIQHDFWRVSEERLRASLAAHP
jgi:hypothetical protein